jgi:hypothetical protein
MLIRQVFFYILTALPFASNALYLTLTQNDLVSSKSAYRIAAEAFSQTLTSSFGIYVFNGVRNLYCICIQCLIDHFSYLSTCTR